MQFATILAAAFAVAVSATPYAPSYGNSTIPSNTTTPASPTGTSSPIGSSSPIPSGYEGAGVRLSTGAMGLLVIGGMAMAL